MTRTARRRWTKELDSLVDGIALGSTGPVLLHGYDPPAGGKWIDDAIPGKLHCLDRNTGEKLWVSPCEVGYGRGFGAGLGPDSDVVVLGPSLKGHRVVRMSLGTGELLGASEMESFDEAIVCNDLCICVSAGRVFAIMTEAMIEAWDYRREGERYHSAARCGDRVYIVFTSTSTNKKQGVLCLNAETGDFEGVVLSPTQAVIHGVAAGDDGVAVLTRDLSTILPPEVATQYVTDLAQRTTDSLADTLSVVAVPPDAQPGDVPLWYEILSTLPEDEVPEAAILADSGKVYLIQDAHLEARDTLTGRTLDDWAVPGLDERVAWAVADGAGLLAEETRVSVFELPA